MVKSTVTPIADAHFEKQKMNLDLDAVNQQLRDASPREIIQWALGLDKPVMATTSFSPNSGVMLHQLASVDARTPVVWVDSGYNTRDTYIVADKLINDLDLNMHVYTPKMTSARRDALMGMPSADDKELHKEFTRQVKLEPFQRAINALNPGVWLTGLRREETEFRKSLDIVSWDSRGILKVAPLFYLSEDEVEDYRLEHDIPTCKRYFDPTKLADNQECGMHTSA